MGYGRLPNDTGVEGLMQGEVAPGSRPDPVAIAREDRRYIATGEIGRYGAH